MRALKPRLGLLMIWGLLAACGAPTKEDGGLSHRNSPPSSNPRSTAELIAELPPIPPLEKMEKPVRDQFQERRQLVEAALNHPGTAASDIAWALGQMGRLHQAYRNLDHALWYLQAAHEQDPQSFDWAYLGGRLDMLLGRFSEAEQLLSKARALRPDQAVASAALGTVARETRRNEDARRYLTEALQLDPKLVAARYELALLDLAEGRAADATTTLERLLEEQPLAYQLRHAMAEALKAQGRDEEAAAQYRRIPLSPLDRVGLRDRDPWMEEIQRLPVSATALERRGRQALLARRWATAADLFSRAEAIAPDRQEIRFNLAMVHFSAGRADQAVAQLEKLILDFPDYPAPYRLLGRIRAAQGRDSEALRRLQQAVELEPGADTHHRALADFYLSRGRIQSALDHYQRAAQLDDRGSEAFVGWAQALLIGGDSKAAAQAVARGLERRPDSKSLRWLALRLRRAAANETAPSFPAPPRSIFELESAAMSRAVDGDFKSATGLQQAALRQAERQATPIAPAHLALVKRRLEAYRRGTAAPADALWALGETIVLGSTKLGDGSPSRR